jgi:hypothetical protein
MRESMEEEVDRRGGSMEERVDRRGVDGKVRVHFCGGWSGKCPLIPESM